MAASILIVDDDESIRDLLRLHLSAAGYEVHVAEDAIARRLHGAAQPARPDHHRHQHAAHGRLRVHRRAARPTSTLPHIPVIFLTSVEDGDQRGKELGAVGYVTKPVRADRLLSLVAQHVPGGAHPIG